MLRTGMEPVTVPAGAPLRATQRAALFTLQQAIYSLDRAVPCVNDTRWISDAETDQQTAARRCQCCPVADLCREYGLAYPKEAGVFGGLTERQRTSATKKRRAHE